MTKKNKKRLIVVLVITVAISIGIYLLRGFFAFIFFFISMDNSSKDELIENYQMNKTSIFSLSEYFEKIVPEEYKVYIEFTDKKHIDLWVYEKADSVYSQWTCLFQQWDIDPFDYEMKPLTKYDSSKYAPKTKDLSLIKNKLNWTDSIFIKIKENLDKANCISIENGNPTEVGFARSGMGKYFYYLFSDSIPNSEIKKWNDSCMYIYYDPQIVLGYGGGAIGSQCFPDPD